MEQILLFAHVEHRLPRVHLQRTLAPGAALRWCVVPHVKGSPQGVSSGRAPSFLPVRAHEASPSFCSQPLSAVPGANFEYAYRRKTSRQLQWMRGMRLISRYFRRQNLEGGRSCSTSSLPSRDQGLLHRRICRVRSASR